MTSAVQRTVSRNDPCPCGSGRRFKDCHGSLRAGPQPGAPDAIGRKSLYRPGGDDWANLTDEDQDRLGALMEHALREQTAQRVRDAERLYRAVLEEAPRTHDALHMLGVIRLGLGDFTDAERLIRDAMALRPEYPAIATNWSLVRRSIETRDRRGIELVCEHALPLLCESLSAAQRRGSSQPAGARDAGARLHVVGPANDVTGEATWLMRRLQDLLAPANPEFWNLPDTVAAPSRWRSLDSHRIDTQTGRRPRIGRVVLTGVASDSDAWLRDPIGEVMVFVQGEAPSTCLERLRRIAADGARSVALVFDSGARARRFGLARHVLPPPIDMREFDAVRESARLRDSQRLRVATVGQDRRRVVIGDDAEHLRAVAERAGRLAILDPGPLRYALGTMRAVVCVPRGEHALASLLAQSDVYLHRVRPWWTEEPHALFGAMLLGVPVLCHRDSMYAEYVSDGIDGWLYDDEAAALRIVDALRADASRVEGAGRAAREKASRLFEPRALGAAYVDLVERWATAA